MKPEGSYARIYAVVCRIPCGRVSTYGAVARVAGLPGRARQVGYALHALSEEEVPWQRVVNARGQISLGAEAGMNSLQRQMLEAEGVSFDDRGRVNLDECGWRVNPS